MSASERHIRARHLPAARGRQQRQPVAPQSRVPQTPPDARNVIEFRNVCMHYPAGDIGLDGATFNVRRGEFLFIVGSTGSGKSTIMRLLIKEREPTSGTIRVAGRDLGSLEHNKVPYYRRNIGVVFQDFKLLPNRTVYDNVAYALSATGARRKEIRTKVPDVLRLTGLSTKLHNYPDQLSGGEQQRVAVARAFVNHPPLLLADEPTGNLDPNTSLGIMQLLYRIYRAGTTVLVATHDSHMVDRMRRRVHRAAAAARSSATRRAACTRRATRRPPSSATCSTAPTASSAATSRPATSAPSTSSTTPAAITSGPPTARRVARTRRPPAAAASGTTERMNFPFFLREVTRSLRRDAGPPFAAMASVLVTMLVLGVFIPIVQATNGAANEVRGKVLVDVFLKTNATSTDVERVRRQLTQETPHVGKVEFVSKAQAYAKEKKQNPEAYELLGSNPLPDTFRVSPSTPGEVGKLRDALAPISPSGERSVIDPAIDEVKNRRDETTKILSATRVVKLSIGLLAALLDPRLRPADLQHDPPVAHGPPARGRGHEARRRDRLVHPLAVRHRGDLRRRDGRAHGDPHAARRQGRVHRPAQGTTSR